METVIYTYGGGQVLYEIFNGIAAFSASNSPYWSAFLMPVLLISSVWIGAIAIAKADIGIFAKKSFIPTYFLLSLLIVPKTHVWINDRVDPTFGVDKVDNIPVAIALVAGMTSSISSSIAELIEGSFSTGDATNFTKTGLAFSSRLTQEARTLRIADVNLRENVKDWCHQCVWLPYLKTNIKGKREAARTADDLVSWVESNGHISLGVYWRNTDGTKEYKTCRETAPLIRQALAVENERGFSTLFSRLFGFTPKEKTGEQLKPYMQDAWNKIANSTKTASQHIQQILVVNALKEGFDDNREKAGYDRLHPELVSINAARSMEAQNMTGLIKGAAASISLPLLQAYLLGFLCVLFFLVIPFCFLPGGMTTLSLWVKMMFSVQMWPVFSCITNALCQMWMERAADTVLQASNGFSIATTTGLTDAAFNVAAWSSGMQMLVPVLAWAFVSKSGYALTSVFQSATGTIESNAARMASEAVDGNVSLGNQSVLNTNMLGHSIAQQSHAGSYNFASSLNTGDSSMVNTISGETIIQENLSSLRTNVNSSDMATAAIGDSLRDAQALTNQHSKTFSKGLNNTSSELGSMMDKLSNGSTIMHNVSDQEQTSINKLVDETKGLMKSMRDSHNLSEQSVANASVAINLGEKGILGKTGLAKLLGIDAAANMVGTAHDQQAIDKVQNTEEGRKLSENVGKLIQFAESHQGQITDSAGRDVTKGFQNQFSELQSSAEAFNNSYTRSKNLENFKSYTESKNFGTSTNENDAWLGFVMDKKGLSKADAASFVNRGGSEAQGLMGEFMLSRTTALRDFVEGSNHVLSTSEIDSFMNKGMKVINSDGQDKMNTMISNADMKTREEIDTGIYNLKSNNTASAAQYEDRFESANQAIDNAHGNMSSSFNTKRHQANLTRVAEKGVKDFKATWIDKAG